MLILKKKIKIVNKLMVKRKNKIIIPKLDDANWAGTRKSEQCTLY